MSGAVDLSALAEKAQRAAAPAAAPAAPGAPAPAGPVAAGPVVDVTEATFEAEVIDRSRQQLVLVDLWASWAQPAVEVTRILESMAQRAGGAWVLAKVDVDAAPGIVQAFGAKGVPMVIAVVGGQLVAAFDGAQPEDKIQGWLDEVIAKVGSALPDTPAAAAEAPQDPRMAEAEKLMDAGDMDGALAAYRAIAEAEPNNVEAASVVRNLEFMNRAAGHDPSIVDTAAPTDVDAQLAAADVLLLGQKPDEAFDRIIEAVKATSGDDRDRARARLLELFELFDPSDPVVVAARKKLALALY
ncbi:MAG: tetratricopeptide repeat protein [Gordonia sp. (in: high G+C Gram-positive bacteria)]|uniref:co-chaperone YbbN n=1 Tax=Gordonia sp. (in: high G+C Gram-positive bacteria) TaxID=84139 RepID=UPI0039E49E29